MVPRNSMLVLGFMKYWKRNVLRELDSQVNDELAVGFARW